VTDPFIHSSTSYGLDDGTDQMADHDHLVLSPAQHERTGGGVLPGVTRKAIFKRRSWAPSVG
jgi:hypothetical protein